MLYNKDIATIMHLYPSCTCFFEGSGVDDDWRDPVPPLSPELDTIYRQVALKIKKDIGMLQSGIRTETEAHVHKLVTEVCLCVARNLSCVCCMTG